MPQFLAGLYSWYPPVGVFIALLAVFGVLVPWFRGDVASKREKALWTGAMFLFVGLEIRSIYLDQAKHDREQTDARKEQLKSFSEIAKGIDASISNSQKQFDATMGRIENTLDASNRAVQNTQPRATITFRGPQLYSPVPIVPSQPLMWNIHWANTGDDPGTDLLHGSQAYIGKPDDLEVQTRLAHQFNEWWRNERAKQPNVIEGVRKRTAMTNVPSFFSFSSDALTPADVLALSNRTMTIYIFVRFVWSDKTGRWVSDECTSYQDPMHDSVVFYPCRVNRDHHYRATWQ